MKLFVFVFGDIKYYDRQNAVVVAETEEQARDLLAEAIADTDAEHPECLYWRGFRVSDAIEVHEVAGPVAFTYGVDG